MKKPLPDCPPPVFFVSVASKGFSQAVSFLFATLAGRSISVAAKRLKGIVGSDLDRVGAGADRGRRLDRNGAGTIH
jgi:hypothetical protein